MTVALRRSWAKDLDAATLYELLKLRVEVFVDDPDAFDKDRHFAVVVSHPASR